MNKVYFFVYNTKKAQGLEVWWGGKGNGLALTIYSKGAWLATFADPFNSTIYNHSSIAMRAATTKIPHLLYEKETYLKAPKVMNDFIYDLFTMTLYDGIRRKTPKYIQCENKGKIPRLVALPSPPSTKWRPTVFQCPKTLKKKKAEPTLAGRGILV